MSTHTNANPAQENKSQANANAQIQLQEGGGEYSTHVWDHRPEAIAQRKLSAIANNSPQAQRLTQLQAMANKMANPGSVPPIQQQSNDTGLPNQLKSGVEQLSGYSMDDVKVHYNSDKPAQLQAHAYAQGTDIHVAPGQERHLPHEAWHVVQQKQGRVQPTTQLKGEVAINDDAGLEQEADQMGAKAMAMPDAGPYQLQKNASAGSPVAQLKDAKIKGVIFGMTNIYNGQGNKVAKVPKGATIEVDEDIAWQMSGSKTLVHIISGDSNIIWNNPEALLNNSDDLWISTTRYTASEDATEEDSEDGVAISAGPITYQNGQVTIPIWGSQKIVVGRNGVSHEGSLPSKEISAPLPSVNASVDIPFAPGAYATAGLEIAPTLAFTISGGTYKTTIGETKSVEISGAGVTGTMGLAITASAGAGVGVANVAGIEAGIFGSLGGEAKLSGTLGGKADFTSSNYAVDLSLKASADIIGKVGAFVQAKLGFLKARKEYSLAEKTFAHFAYERTITLGTEGGKWLPTLTDFTKKEFGDRSSSKTLKTVDGKTYQQLVEEDGGDTQIA